MRINFVTESESRRWALRPIAESLATHIPHATVSTRVDIIATWNIFVNYALYESVPTLTAAWFTHREFRSPLREVFDDVAQKVDWCFAQSECTATLLPTEKTSVLRIYPQPQFHRGPIVLGVVGRPYKSGRKRFSWIPRLEEIEGIEVVQTLGNVPLEQMPAFYETLDYLVVIAENEGGPMPVVEALAMGVPVIAPNVGWCWEFPVLRYTTKDDLLDLVRELVIPEDGWKLSAQMILGILRRRSV